MLVSRLAPGARRKCRNRADRRRLTGIDRFSGRKSDEGVKEQTPRLFNYITVFRPCLTVHMLICLSSSRFFDTKSCASMRLGRGNRHGADIAQPVAWSL